MASGLLAFLFGASFGSFVNLVADRLPVGMSLVSPRSSCPGCGRRLTPLELVPVLSYLALRGRCYQCGNSISVRVLAVELLLGLLALYLWRSLDSSWALALVFGFVALFLLLAVIDLEQGIIPDFLVYSGLGVAVLLSPWWRVLGLDREFLGGLGPGWLLSGSLAGGVAGAGFFGLVIVASRGGMGWGDVKMGALVGVVCGIPGSIVAFLIAVLSGGLVAALLLALRLRRRKQTMPFGPFLALGGTLALLWGSPIWRWYSNLW